MWRRNDVRFGNNWVESNDSDQSISEEEGLDSISLCRGENNKGTMQVISQLEILRESCELHSTELSSASHAKKRVYHIEDEVEIPMFNHGDGPSHLHRAATATLPCSNEGMIYLPAVASISYSDEEIISDDEKIDPPALRSAKKNIGGTWSEASREVEALARSNEKASCSSHDVFMNERKSSRGGCGRKKAKPKFSFPLHSHKKDQSSVVSDSNGRTSSDHIPVEDEIGAAADDDMDNDMAELQLNFHANETEQSGNLIVPFELAHKHDTKGHSMAEFLNCFLERSDQQGNSEVEIQKKRRRVHKMSERNTSPLHDVIVDDDDDLPEALDSGSPFQSEDDEGNAQSVKSIIPRTMADQFDEAFGTTSFIDVGLHVAFPKPPLCSGLHTKLQQVMQSDKEREMHSLKNASAKSGFKDDGMSILVRILSKSLEAKLIVCCCTSVRNGKNSHWENNLGAKMKGTERTLSIIFNPRLCSDVDLEVGNLICIRPPWKEVQVNDEVIYLCSYFSQVQP